jgi:capsular polysaccharide biosynthesis protein
MHLRQYWTIVRRRWYVVALVMALAAIGGAALLLLSPRQYSVNVRLLLNRVPVQEPTGEAPFFRYDDYYRFLATEYLLDDLVEEVDGNQFARSVTEGLHAKGVNDVKVEEVEQMLEPERQHRVLMVEVTASSPERAMRTAEVVEGLLTQGTDRYASLDGSELSARVIHRDPEASSNRLRQILTFALELLLALLLGLGLAFLLHYLDDRVQTPEDLRSLDLPLLGHLPAAR